MAEFKMPSLGADMTAGTLIGWMKKIGDEVRRGDVIAEVDTDKGVIEVEVFQDGVIEKLLVKEYEKVPVGTVLAIISETGALTEATRGVESPKEKDETVATGRPIAVLPEQTVRIHASPVAKKLAEELGVDLKDLIGTGPQGRIQREDVELAAKTSATLKASMEEPREAESAEPDRHTRMRLAIAAAMARSKREIPHYYLGTTIDMTRALDWLDALNATRPIKHRILYSVLLLKAVAVVLRSTPELNATWENNRLNLKESINIGTAISLREGGLIAPALKETDKQSLDELMKNLRDLVQRPERERFVARSSPTRPLR